MHSLGMSMVRERSVKSFLERIQTRKFNVDIPYDPTSTSASSACASAIASVSTSASVGTGSGSGLSNDTFLPPPKSAIGWLELRKGFHTMLCEDGNLLIFRDGVISSPSSSSQSLNQVKNKDTSVSGVNSPSVSPCTSPTTASSHSHQSPKKWGGSLSGSALDRIMTEIDADEKEEQGTFLTIQTNKEDSTTSVSASASVSAKLESAQIISSNQYGGPINVHGTAPPSHHWNEGIKFLISSLRDTFITETIAIGSWRIVISIVPTERNEEHSLIDETSHGTVDSGKKNNVNSAKKIEKNSDSTGTDSERILQSVRTLLDGHFIYHLNVPEHCTYLSVPFAHMESGSSSSKSSTKDSKKVRYTCCIVLYCIVLYCIVLYCIVLYCIVLHCIVLYCIVLYCIVLYCIVLHCIVLYCIVLYCIGG